MITAFFTGKIVLEATELLRQTLGESIANRDRAQRRRLAGVRRSSQLETALLNLAIDARDAMPGGGKLTIETGCVAREALAPEE